MQIQEASLPDDIMIDADAGGCTASGVYLGEVTVASPCAVYETSNDAPLEFPLGPTTVTWTVDSEGSSNFQMEEYACPFAGTFPTPLNTTNGRLTIESSTTVTSALGETLQTDDLNSIPTNACNSSPCIESGTSAELMEFSVELGSGIDGSLSSSTTISSDRQYTEYQWQRGHPYRIDGYGFGVDD